MIRLADKEGHATDCASPVKAGAPLAPKAIVSYDDTPNDHDALALARMLANAGIELVLAYVRHAPEDERERERLEEHEAAAVLERGARAPGLPVASRTSTCWWWAHVQRLRGAGCWSAPTHRTRS